MHTIRVQKDVACPALGTFFAVATLSVGMMFMSPPAIALPQDQPTRVHGPLPSGQDVKTPARQFDQQALDPARAAALALQQAPTRSSPSPAATAQAKPDRITAPRQSLVQPLFHQETDGSLWAVGNTYKARFAADGFTFIPYLSPDAPRNFPIRVIVDAVSTGAHPLAFQSAQPLRTGDSLVCLDRGLFTETYNVRTQSVEQTFTFDQPPAVLSDGLVIRLSLTSELTAQDAGDHLRFSNEHGSVSYSKAVLVDAHQRRTDLRNVLADGANNEITIPAALLATAAWPITIDPVVQTNTVDSGVSSRLPDTAYDVTSNTWLVVWEVDVSAADGDVFARRTDAQGAPIGSVVTIDSSTDNWRNPRVANNNDNNNYLVVAERGAAGSRAIWGRVVSAADGATGSQFEISDSAVTGEKINPDLGGDPFIGALPVHWLVAWERVAAAADHDIHARLVTPSAATTAVPEGSTIFLDNSTSTLDINPAVSPSNLAFAWVVVWQRDLANDDIFGARVFFDGSILHTTFPVDNTAADTQHPSVATPFPTSRYVVVYEEAPGVLSDIRARVFDDVTVLAEGDLTLIENIAPSLERRRPSVDANSTQFVVACEQESAVGAHVDAYISTYCWSGQSFSLAESHRVLSSSVDDDARPTVAGAAGSNGPVQQFLAVWNGRSIASGLGNINSARYDTGTCCPTDVNDNGATDVDDLIVVILSWGVCATCAGDVNGDGQVDVDDLVAVILGWGTCV